MRFGPKKLFISPSGLGPRRFFHLLLETGLGRRFVSRLSINKRGWNHLRGVFRRNPKRFFLILRNPFSDRVPYSSSSFNLFLLRSRASSFSTTIIVVGGDRKVVIPLIAVFASNFYRLFPGWFSRVSILAPFYLKVGVEVPSLPLIDQLTLSSFGRYE